jgi:hypothetical protein
MIYDQAASYEVPVSEIVPNVYADQYEQRSMGEITGVYCRFTDVSATKFISIFLCTA